MRFIAIAVIILISSVFASSCSESSAANGNTAEASEAETVADIDLSMYSGNILIAHLQNIVNSPEEHIGKSIKLRGAYYAYDDLYTGEIHLLMIECPSGCPKSFEFTYSGGVAFPEENAPIEIIGVVESVQYLEYTYYRLAVGDDDFTVLG